MAAARGSDEETVPISFKLLNGRVHCVNVPRNAPMRDVKPLLEASEAAALAARCDAP